MTNHCAICNQDYSTPSSLRQHLTTIKHRKNVIRFEQLEQDERNARLLREAEIARTQRIEREKLERTTKRQNNYDKTTSVISRMLDRELKNNDINIIKIIHEYANQKCETCKFIRPDTTVIQWQGKPRIECSGCLVGWKTCGHHDCKEYSKKHYCKNCKKKFCPIHTQLLHAERYCFDCGFQVWKNLFIQKN